MILRLDVRADRFARAQNRTVPQRGTYKCALREMDDCGTWYHGGRTYEFLETRANSPRPSALCRITEREGMWLITSHALPRVALV